jgi:hypothetical protein
VYWRECEGIVMVGVMSSCWRGLVFLFVQSSCVMTIMVVLFGLVCCANLPHFDDFWDEFDVGMWT